MPRRKPTPAQAQLHLQLYDLRREPRLRQARDWFLQHYLPEAPEDMLRLAPPGSAENASMRMVISYWDQVCVMVEHGLLHQGLLFETTNEFYIVWDRVARFLPGIRAYLKNPYLFEALEKCAKAYEAWAENRAPGYVAAMLQAMRPTGGPPKPPA
jgi:hypothetical protein